MILRQISSTQKLSQSSLNVVPFIDVLLVLVVLLMSAQAALVQSMTIDLPRTQTESDSEKMFTEKPLIISLDKDKKLYIENDFIEREQLQADKMLLKLTALEKQGKNPVLYFQAHAQCSYQEITDILDMIKYAGFEKVTLVSEREQLS